MARRTTDGVALQVAPCGDVAVATSSYRLTVPRSTAAAARDVPPCAVLAEPDGTPWAELCLLASVDTTAGPDDSYDPEPPVVARTGDGVDVTVTAAGTQWATKSVTVHCRPDHLAVSVTVAGGRHPGARLGRTTVLGGTALLSGGACGAFASGIRFASVFSPAPSEPVAAVRPAGHPVVLGVVGNRGHGRLHALFSPPPLCWAFGRQPPTPAATGVPAGPWLAVSVEAPVAALTMTHVGYHPVDGGFSVSADYEGHTEVGRQHTTPLVVLRPVPTVWAGLDAYRDSLVAHGWAPPSRGPRRRPPWWSRPILCGWGAQCARAGTTLAPADLCRQEVYDALLDLAEDSGIRPGTVVVDDRWQRHYGTAEVDTEAWPDLRGWVATQHAAGRRVLLWWKAWDPTGLPAGECVRRPDGTPVAADVNDPGYRARVRRTVTALLGPHGLDADGLKVDFTQLTPSGSSLTATPGPWGIAALHALLGLLHTAATSAKPDALLVTHSVHPSFGDVTDMVRLNDLARRDPAGRPVPPVEQLRFRHAVAVHALPGHLVDTDQWPMPDRAAWQDYVREQPRLGVPSLYYLEAIDTTGELLTDGDRALVAGTWARYTARDPAQQMAPAQDGYAGSTGPAVASASSTYGFPVVR